MQPFLSPLSNILNDKSKKGKEIASLSYKKGASKQICVGLQ